MNLNSSLEHNKMAGAFGWGIVEEGWRKGPWTAEEDKLLIAYVNMHGEGRWNSVAKLVGLRRNGKSCRLRWVNYLRPDLKRGRITPHEENIIVQLHARWGNRWSTIARSLPGRTDNEIKNYWRTHFKKSGKSSRGLEKQKNRILQFKKQQQQRKQQQQQQQQPQQVDMKTIMSQLEESDCGLFSGMNGSDMKYICPQVASEDQSLSPMFNGASSLSEVHSIDDIFWGGLWNLDDVHGDDGHTSVTSRALDQNQLSFFSPLILM